MVRASFSMGGRNDGRSDSDVLVPLVDVFIVVFPWATTRNSKTRLDVRLCAFRLPGLGAGGLLRGSAIYRSANRSNRSGIGFKLQSKTKGHPARKSSFVKRSQQTSRVIKSPLISGRDSIERECGDLLLIIFLHSDSHDPR